MSRRRTTFGKLQRDRDKQAKQKAKQERRAERAEQPDEAEETVEAPEVDQSKVLAQLDRPVLVLGNLSRDQLDRTQEVRSIAALWRDVSTTKRRTYQPTPPL